MYGDKTLSIGLIVIFLILFYIISWIIEFWKDYHGEQGE